jgi:zeaxanthin glucosyltransferase
MEINVSMPELVAFPRVFDFPASAAPDRAYVGPCVCLDRPEPPFPLDQIPQSAPLAYCALGGFQWRPRRADLRFFRAAVGAARLMPQWRWVIVVGDIARAEEPAPIPDNATIVRFAPQIALLRRAHVMIGHAGANSFKESVMLGVPAVLFPLGADQPGVAARAAHHGVALRSRFEAVSAVRLKGLAEEAADSPYIRAQLERLRKRFLAEDAAQRALQVVESFLPPEATGTAAPETAPGRAVEGALAIEPVG